VTLRRRIKTHIIRYHTRNRIKTPQIKLVYPIAMGLVPVVLHCVVCVCVPVYALVHPIVMGYLPDVLCVYVFQSMR
jgi:hypothetical protein